MASHFSFIQLTLILLSLFLMIKPTKAQPSFIGTKSANCAGICGNITIPYPFGIGIECAYDSKFNISCDNTSFPINRPFLTFFNLEVLRNITRYSVTVNYIPPNNSSQIVNTSIFVGALDWTLQGNCSRNSSICGSHTECYTYGIQISQLFCECKRGYRGNPYLPDGCQDFNECERGYCTGEGYICENYVGGFNCRKRRNKARIIGIGIGASLGSILLLIVLWWMFKLFKKIKKAKLKKKLFKRNGGLLLQQQLASGDDGTVEKTKLFTSEELEKATDHYNKDRILGQGGQGTVYKGMLTDGRIVAIKMSKTVDEGRCLNLNGRKRPTMNEVARELELIRMSNGSCDDINHQDHEEVEYAIGEVGGPWEMGETSTRSF